jgi:Tol biopolymer transport system component
LFSNSTAGAQTTARVSVATGGVQSNGPSLGPGMIAASGAHVAFTSDASNLVPGDTTTRADAFVHDRASGATVRASVSSAGVQGNESSTEPRLSADGNFVAYISTATNLVAGDTNARDDVFVRDRAAGTTVRASVSTAGTQGNGHCFTPVISADGRAVAFESGANNLVAADSNGVQDVFVRDLAAGTTTRVSVDSGGLQSNAASFHTALSADGRFVAFTSPASNLVAGDTNGVDDVFVHDRQLAITVRGSVGPAGVQANSGSAYPALSADGACVAFTSAATNLVAGDLNNMADVFVHDLANSSNTLASVDSNGGQSNAFSYLAGLSASGRHVVFVSEATNLVPGDTNGRYDVFVHDVLTGVTTRESVSSAGVQANGHSSPNLPPSISADGRSIAFDSGASNLIAGDTNSDWDVFVRDRYAAPSNYCSAGTSASGCSASIGASGQPEVAHASPCAITVTGVDGQRAGIVFYGTSSLAQAWCSAGGTSFLCVKSPAQRTPPQSSQGTSGACDGTLALDWNAFQLANPGALGQPWAAGAKAFVQGWWRDPASCKTTSLSNALELTYQP